MILKKLRLAAAYAMMATMAVLSACGGSDDPQEPDMPQKPVTLSTPVISSLGETSFTAYSSITANGNVITSAGFCYSTAQNPTVSSEKTNVAIENASITAQIGSLNAGTTYYVRAFALVGSDVIYSSQAQATTTSAVPEVTTPAEVLAYRGPSYADDYRRMADWGQRSKWNLANVHDPTVMLADDGYFYMYQTDASFGNAHAGNGHFHGRRSKDLVNWEYLGATMPETPPTWIKERLNAYRADCGLQPINNPAYGYWAPTARNCGGGLYRMYYSVVVTDQIEPKSPWTERAFIGLMETNDPASNNWEDKGFVVCSASDRGLDWMGAQWEGAYFRYNAIDPTYVITPEGEHWLIYGSWHSGFAALQLDGSTGKPINDLPNPWGTIDDIGPFGQLVATRNKSSRWQGSEGPEVVYHDGYYYMFMAYDGLDVPYNTRVVRSTKVNGPYTDMYGTNVTQFGGDAYPIMTHPYKFNNSPGWVGISHCAIFDDGKGNWYYASQARFPADYDDWAPNAIMLGHVRAIRWTKDGWPLVMPERYGAVPQVPITEAEIAGSWEHIDLGYKYGVQKGAEMMKLSADHKITEGPWKGSTWTFDEASQTLAISNGIELYMMRECNWESPDRRATIVYAALGNKKTYWGKKD